MRARLAIVTVVMAIASVPSPTFAHDSDNHPADDIYQPMTWNGWRIYLSPAHHWTGPKYGCGDYVEDDNMPRVAQHAAHIASLGAGSLQDRGYRVRVGKGDPDDNVDRSNAWNADRHIAMHSNASGNAQCGGSGRGTRVFYYSGSTQGQDLAGRLRTHVGASSPGEPDSISTHTFYELSETTAKAAYLEAEFHDWTGGANWLEDYQSWSWKVGYAVDVHLNYP